MLGRPKICDPVLISTCGGAPDDVIANWSSVETEAVNTTRTVGIAATPDGNGYWIADSSKMAYKRAFRPLEFFGPDGWAELPTV